MINQTTTFLIPSCRGAEALNKTVSSVVETATNPTLVDFAIKVDTPEEEFDYRSFFAAKNYPSAVNIIFNPTKCLGNHESFFNTLLESASGNLLWLFSDDCVIKSKNWQSQFDKISDQYSDMIFAINHRKHSWAALPVVTKKWTEVLGYVTIGFADTWIQNVGIMANRYIQVADPIDIHIGSNSVRPQSKKENRQTRKIMRQNYRQASRKIIEAIGDSNAKS